MAALRIVRNDEPVYGKITKVLFNESGYKKYDDNYVKLDQFLHRVDPMVLNRNLTNMVGVGCSRLLLYMLNRFRTQRYGGVAFPFKEVASTLKISEKTARTYLKTIRELPFMEFKRTYHHGEIVYIFKFKEFEASLEW